MSENILLISHIFGIILTVSIMDISVVYFNDHTSFGDYEILRIAGIFAWYFYSQNWYWILVLTSHIVLPILLYTCLCMKASKFTVGFLHLLHMFAFAIIFLTLSSSAVCDPLVRVIPSPSSSPTNDSKLYVVPYSDIEYLDIEYLREMNPYQNGICLKNSLYTKMGQNVVVISHTCCLVAYTVAIICYFIFIHKRTALSTIGQVAVTCLGVSVISQLILNDDEWDWRVLVGLIISMCVSSYLAVSVLYIQTPLFINTTEYIHTAAWMFVSYVHDVYDICVKISMPYNT